MGFSLKGLFGGKSNFTLPDREARAKIDKLTQFAESDISGPSQAGQLALDDIQKQQLRAQSGLEERQQSGLSTGLSNQALFGGGSSAGSAERLTRASNQQGIQSQQGLFGDFGDIRRRGLQEDLFNEQARRDKARDQALGAELGLVNARTSAELGRAGIDAQRRGQNLGFLTAAIKGGSAAASGGGGGGRAKT